MTNSRRPDRNRSNVASLLREDNRLPGIADEHVRGHRPLGRRVSHRHKGRERGQTAPRDGLLHTRVDRPRSCTLRAYSTRFPATRAHP